MERYSFLGLLSRADSFWAFLDYPGSGTGAKRYGYLSMSAPMSAVSVTEESPSSPPQQHVARPGLRCAPNQTFGFDQGSVRLRHTSEVVQKLSSL